MLSGCGERKVPLCSPRAINPIVQRICFVPILLLQLCSQVKTILRIWHSSTSVCGDLPSLSPPSPPPLLVSHAGVTWHRIANPDLELLYHIYRSSLSLYNTELLCYISNSSAIPYTKYIYYNLYKTAPLYLVPHSSAFIIHHVPLLIYHTALLHHIPNIYIAIMSTTHFYYAIFLTALLKP